VPEIRFFTDRVLAGTKELDFTSQRHGFQVGQLLDFPGRQVNSMKIRTSVPVGTEQKLTRVVVPAGIRHSKPRQMSVGRSTINYPAVVHGSLGRSAARSTANGATSGMSMRAANNWQFMVLFLGGLGRSITRLIHVIGWGGE
jgi:hypothetical protein